ASGACATTVARVLTIRGDECRASAGELRVTRARLGAGLAWYAASDLFVAGSLALAVVDGVGDDGGQFAFGAGPALAGLVGKEWWSSEDVALGVAGEVVLGRTNEQDATYHHTVASGALLMTLTR